MASALASHTAAFHFYGNKSRDFFILNTAIVTKQKHGAKENGIACICINKKAPLL
jgi:hypothetical protein